MIAAEAYKVAVEAIDAYCYYDAETDVGSERAKEMAAALVAGNCVALPTIVCLCGSTRFYDTFQQANFDETMAGKIVLSVGFYPHSTEQAHATIRSWKRHRKPYWRINYTLDIDGKGTKWGAGPYSEDELIKEQHVNITQITVSYGETQSLPEYSNVKPAITLTAVLNDGDDLALVEGELWTQAKNAVREQIDLALEASNIPAKWSGEPRYQVLKTRTSSYYERGKIELPKLVTIIPNALKLDDRFVGASWQDSRKLRYRHAQRIADETAADGYTIVDCSDGDLSRLMALLPEEPVKVPQKVDAYVSEVDRLGIQQADDEEDERDLDEEDEDEDEESEDEEE